MQDKDKNHQFKQGQFGCEICGKKNSHLIHKAPKASYYGEGKVIGQYFVGPKGEFRRISA
jgi:hypothetical protein